jgi:REP-associated tyrosine transposase
VQALDFSRGIADPVFWVRVADRTCRGCVYGEIHEVVTEFGGMVIEVETMPDHVHLLVELPPQVAASNLVKILKGLSSRRLRQEFAHLARMKCLWAPSYFVSTVGGAPLEVVRRYVENQKLAAARKVKAA